MKPFDELGGISWPLQKDPRAGLIIPTVIMESKIMGKHGRSVSTASVPKLGKYLGSDSTDTLVIFPTFHQATNDRRHA